MKRKKRLSAIAIALILWFIQGGMTTVLAEDELVVSNIRAMVSEKGSSVYSLSVFAGVTNNGETRNIMIEVIARNKDGFQIGNAVLSGPVEQGQRRMLSTVIQMQKQDFENIDHWEWKKP
jgi:hypothetical protein